MQKQFRKSTDPYKLNKNYYNDQFGESKDVRRSGNRQYQKKGSRSQNPKIKKNNPAHFKLNGSFGNPFSEKKPQSSKKKVMSGVQVPNFA